MIEETWDERELPILRAIYRAREEGTDLNMAGHEAAADLEDRLYIQTIADLTSAGYLEAAVIKHGGGLATVRVLDMTPAGLRVVGAWPSGTLADHFINALAARVESEEDPERKKMLTQLLEMTVDVGKGVLVGVLTHVATRGI